MARAERHTVEGYAGVYYVNDDQEGKIFYIRYRRGGRDSKLYEEKVGTSRQGWTAKKASEERADRIRGKALTNSEARAKHNEPQPDELTLETLYKIYQASLPEKFTRKTDNTNFKRLASIQNVRIEDLTTSHIELLKKELEKTLSPQSIKHTLTLITRTINYAVKTGIISQPDTKKLYIKKPTFDNQKTEVMTNEQFEKYLQALDEEEDQDSAAFLRLALYTGMRKGAIIGLKWSDIDFERNIIALQAEYAKNKKLNYIIVTSEVIEILKKVTRTSEFVFPGKEGGKREDFRRVARRVKKKAGLPSDFRQLHGLRHNFASRAASTGEIDLYTLQRQLTHESPEMTQRYAHLADEAQRRAAEKIGEAMKVRKKVEKNDCEA